MSTQLRQRDLDAKRLQSDGVKLSDDEEHLFRDKP